MGMEEQMDPTEVLKRPYSRILVPDPDGRFTAEMLEFPNCVAFGDTAIEALSNLEEVAAEWVAAAIEQDQNIPEPLDSADFSGKLVLRMSASLHRKAALCAERDGVSLNQFIVTSLAEAVGERARSAFPSFQPQVQAVANFHLRVGGSIASTQGATGFVPEQIGTPSPTGTQVFVERQ
jgi:predicted RNase H-like HicB family nuclease